MSPAYFGGLGELHGFGQKRPAAAKIAEFERKYGSVERVLWMQQQPSVVSGRGPCVNAHVGQDGTGRKGFYTTIVPLTGEEHGLMSAPGGGIETFCTTYNTTVERLLEQAIAMERLWRLSQGRWAW